MKCSLKTNLLALMVGVGFMLFLPEARTQIKATTKDLPDKYLLEKEVPKRPDYLVFDQNGSARPQFVIQLARFENIAAIPESFPKGSFLWLNPDHQNEALLLHGKFYSSFEKAQADALRIRGKGLYPGAFARTKPFLVKYE